MCSQALWSLWLGNYNNWTSHCGPQEDSYTLRVAASYCYSRQVARYEQRIGGRGQVAGNYTACKQRGSTGKQRKAGTSRLTGNHTFWVMSILEADKERWGKAGISCIHM